ncbi:MAG: alpha/beta hydrolase [Bacteroidota bacterium]
MRNFLFLSLSLLLGSHVYASSIDSSMYISIEGIEQYISFQGNKADAPLLLYLHGGPGQAASKGVHEVMGNLSQDFVVVHWDQRNAGKTLARNVDSSRVTLAQMQKDAEAVFLFLLQHFDKQKLTLVANSWGNVLGFALADKYPDKVAHFVAISPDIHAKKSQKIALSRLKIHFNNRNDKVAMTELAKVSIPHSSIQEMVLQYKWESIYNGETVTDEMVAQYMPYFKDWEAKWMPLYQELYKRNLSKEIKKLDCKVSFFLGKSDYTANSQLAAKYYKKLAAAEKSIYWFNSGHNIFSSEPVILKECLLKCLNEK